MIAARERTPPMTTTYSVTRTIDAPCEKVWELLTDADSYATWNPTIISIEGPITEGSRVRLVSAVNPKRAFSLKVTSVRAPHAMVWSDGMPLGLFKGVRTYGLEPLDGGGTEFTMAEVYSGPLAPLITKSIPDMTEAFEQFADGLKRASESA
jgi:uncharacterized protein YndB with AHSA1/START domain